MKPKKNAQEKGNIKPIKKVCFVIIGFGIKNDPNTGRSIDLDKTFTNLIQPVFKNLNIECFRAKDISHSGIIDAPMYEWILKADIVIADISTLNPNVLYELGVRHALRPFSTIVISEKGIISPFDINHTLIEMYEHLGPDIGVSEAQRFKTILKNKIKKILTTRNTDSPVYTFLPKLKPPSFNNLEIEKMKKQAEKIPSLSVLINDGDKLKDKGDYKTAKQIYEAALAYDLNNVSIIQKIALVTYKLGKPTKVKALKEADSILSQLNPTTTTWSAVVF